MKKEKETQKSAQADQGRRSFIKKAVVGAVLAAPMLESLTKSDVLVKSAAAYSGPIKKSLET